MEITITLGTSTINYFQLSLLGCRGEETDNAFHFLTPKTTWSEIYFKTLLEKKKISINAEYWILVLQEKLRINADLSELNWLIDAGTFIPLRGSLDAKYRLKIAIKVLKDYINTEINTLARYRLHKILGMHEIDDERQQEEGRSDIQINALIAEAFENVSMDNKLISLSGIESRAITSRPISNKFKLLPLPLRLTYATELAPRLKRFIIQQLSKGIKQFNPGLLQALHGKKIIAIGSGLGPILLMQGGNVIGSILTLTDNPSDKRFRDSVVTLGFVGAQVFSSGMLTWFAVDPAIGKLVAISLVVGKSLYDSVSNTIEYWDYNLSFGERYNIFSRSVWGATPFAPSVEEYVNHKNAVDALAKNYFSILKDNPDIRFIAGSIGQLNTPLSFEDYVKKEYGSAVWDSIKPIKILNERRTAQKVAREYSKRYESYEKNYKSYLAEQPVLKAAPTKIIFDNDKKRKISRLTPSSDPASELLCFPEFQSKEPEDTATYKYSPWFCKNAFMLAMSRTAIYSDSKPFGVFDMSLQSSGAVEVVEKVDYKPIFITGKNSAAAITGARKNSQNLFLIREGFKGVIIGDPLSGTLSNTNSTLSTVLVNKNWTVNFNAETLSMQETNPGEDSVALISEAKAYYINEYIGHLGQDKVDCSENDLSIINTLGGKSDAMDQLTNCKQAALYSHSKVVNTKPGEAHYVIQPDSRNITFYHGPHQMTSFLFSMGIPITLKDSQFQYNAKENIFRIKKSNNEVLLTINSFIQTNSDIVFTDSDGYTISPICPQAHEPKEAGFVDCAHFTYTIRAQSDTDANIKYQALVTDNPNKKFLGTLNYLYLSFKTKSILGNEADNLLIIEDLAHFNYVVGFEGSDQYILTNAALNAISKEQSYKIIIHNEAQGSIDKLYLPVSIEQITCFAAEENLIIKFFTHPNLILLIENYSKDKAHQHLVFIDRDDNYFIPLLSKDTRLSLVSYQLTTEKNNNFITEINSEYSKKIVVENNLPIDFIAYRNNKNLLLVATNQEEGASVISLPLNQIADIDQLQFFSTQEASLVNENEVKAHVVHLSDYVDTATELTAVIQASFESELIDYYKITEDSLRVNQKKKIYHNSSAKNQKQGYLVLEKELVEKFKFSSSKKNLLLELIDKKEQSRTIVLEDWESLEHRLDGILIDDKVFITGLSAFSQHENESLTQYLNEALLIEGIDEQLQTVPYIYQALVFELIIANKWLQKPALKVLGFDLEKDIRNFLQAVSSKKAQDFELDKKLLGKTVLWIYAKLGIRFKQNLLSNLITSGIHEHYFDDFDYQVQTRPGELLTYFLDGIEDYGEEVAQKFIDEKNNKFIRQRSKRIDKFLLPKKDRNSNVIQYTLVPRTNHTIYHKQFQSGIATGITEPKEERKNFFIDLGESNANRNQPTSVSITQEGNDLIFTFVFDGYPDKNTIIVFKNYDHPEHRISGIIANGQRIFDELERLRIEDFASIEKILNAALIKVQAQRHRARNLEHFIDPEYTEESLKAFLISKALAQSSKDLHALATAFGFRSPRELMKFYKAYLAKYSEENLRTGYIHSIFQAQGERWFFKLMYLYVVEATQTSLTDEQIQRAFPLLTKTSITELVEAYQTVPRSNLSVQEKNLSLKSKLSNIVESELSSDTQYTSTTPQILEIDPGMPDVPYYYLGFREKDYLNLANINYDKIEFELVGEQLRILLIDSTGEFKRTTRFIYLNNWLNDPFYQLYGLINTKRNWQFDLPRVSRDLKKQPLIDLMQRRIDETLKTQSSEYPEEQMYEDQAQPQVASNQINVHLNETEEDQIAEWANKVKEQEKKRLQYFEKGNHITNAAEKARTKEAERSWLQSAGKWFYGIAGSGLALGMGYLTWLGYRRFRRGGGYTSVSTVGEELKKVVIVPALASGLPGSNAETILDREENPSLEFDTVEQEGLNKPSSSSIDFSRLEYPLQDTLLFADCVMRNLTGKKYISAVGNYSLESQRKDYLDKLKNEIMPLLNRPEDCSYAAFEEEDYFANEMINDDEDDTFFSIENLFEKGNDRDKKIKLRKNTAKVYAEEHVV